MAPCMSLRSAWALPSQYGIFTLSHDNFCCLLPLVQLQQESIVMRLPYKGPAATTLPLMSQVGTTSTEWPWCAQQAAPWLH